MTLYLSNRDGNGKTSEEGHYKFQTSVFSGSVLGNADLLVTQNSPLSMSVLIAAGQYRIDTGDDYAYTGWNSVSTPISISTADPANPRITSIVLYVDKNASTSPSPPNNPGIAKFIAINGNPGAVPTPPNSSTIQTAIGAGNPYIVLANVTVPAAASNIVNANISDQRVKVSLIADVVSSLALQTNSVSTGSVQDSAITTTKLANSSVTADKIASGAITPLKWSNPYKFSVYRSGANAAGVIIYNVKNFDTNNNFNIVNGRYTVPVNGFYQFNVLSSQTVSAAPQDPQTTLRKNGTTEIGFSHFVNMYNGASSGNANISVLVQLNAGDFIDVVSGNRPLDVSTPARNTFSGFLVSPT